MTVARAQASARDLLKVYEVASPPVPVERIARQMGIRIQYGPLDNDLSGMAHIREGVTIIGVNSLHAPNRQRFTIAHEIAHIRLHREILESAVHVDRVLLRDRNSSTGTDSLEIEANAFASELLMPADMMRAALGGRDAVIDDDEQIATLAKKFRVSESAMRYRLSR